MRKSIAATTMAASLTLGGAAGVALFTPSLSAAAQTEETTETTSESEHPRLEAWVSEAVAPLVPDTISQAQADAVVDAIVEAAPDRPHRHRLGPRGPVGEAVAEVLGLSTEELHERLRGGESLADIAEAEGVEESAVVDAVVARIEEHLDRAVADGRLSEQEAARKLEGAESRAEELLDRTFDGGRFGPGPRGAPGPSGS